MIDQNIRYISLSSQHSIGREKMTRDWHEEMTILINKIQDYYGQHGFVKAVVGLSGGIDSAVTAAIMAEALGAANVHCLMLPYGEQGTGHAIDVIKKVGLCPENCETINIKPIVHSYLNTLDSFSPLRLGNFCARVRMSILFDQSKKHNAIVIGTTNKTEFELGYYTLFGDGACGLEILTKYYKTEIFQLAEALSVPETVINRAPSAELWEGQTDEEELGLSYFMIDKILAAMHKCQKEGNDKWIQMAIVEGYFEREDVDKVTARILANAFKRNAPVILWERVHE